MLHLIYTPNILIMRFISLTETSRAALLLGVAAIIAVIVGGVFYLVGKNDGKNLLTVTGSARQTVQSDTVLWRSSISRNVLVTDQKTGYAQLARDLATVQSFLKANNISEEAITITPITVMEDWSQQQVSFDQKCAILRQNIEVNSPDVAGITAVAQKISDVINQGVYYQTDSLEYYYSKLAESRVNLLTDATADARARAESMAKASNQRVGSLSSATSGVVQVLSKTSTEVSDYGAYDTDRKSVV